MIKLSLVELISENTSLVASNTSPYKPVLLVISLAIAL